MGDEGRTPAAGAEPIGGRDSTGRLTVGAEVEGRDTAGAELTGGRDSTGRLTVGAPAEVGRDTAGAELTGGRDSAGRLTAGAEVEGREMGAEVIGGRDEGAEGALVDGEGPRGATPTGAEAPDEGRLEYDPPGLEVERPPEVGRLDEEPFSSFFSSISTPDSLAAKADS